MPDINSTWTDENPDSADHGSDHGNSSPVVADHLTSIPTSTSSLDLKDNNTTLTNIEPHLKPPISLSTTRKRCTPLNRALINRDLEVSEEEIIYLSRQLRHTNFMFSANSTSKRGGWNYLVTPVILDGDSYTFDPAGDYLMDEHLVTFELSPFKPLYFTRDSHDWIQHNMTIDTKILPHIKICKQHKDWASKPNLARFQALERVKSNIYVARTLKDFQEALERVASMSSRLQALRVAADEMHTQSSGLKVPSNSLVRTFGKHDKDESEWLLCEEPCHPVNECYVLPYQFGFAEENKWSDLIHALVHFAYHRTGASSLIAQVYCDKLGNLSNLMCFTRGYPHVGIPGEDFDHTIKMAFVHFKDHHQCNTICKTLDLFDIQTGYASNKSD